MELEFKKSAHLSLGVEIELQLINRRTLELSQRCREVLRLARPNPHLKPELFQGMLEIDTGICSDVHEVERDLRHSMAVLAEACQELDLMCASTGTHPSACYTSRLISPLQRYVEVIGRHQWIARRLMIFGLHVHVGMRSREDCIRNHNFLRRLLPHLLALSVSSPFWRGQTTGLSSVRSTIYESCPTTGVPAAFSSWDDFTARYLALLCAGSIDCFKDLWWDIRPSPDKGTVEIRVCDGTATLAETLAIVAVIHCLSAWFDRRTDEERAELGLDTEQPDWIVRENKWRAARYGMAATFIVDEHGRTERAVDEIERWLERLERDFAAFGYQRHFSLLQSLLTGDTSAQRQLTAFGRRGRIDDVIRHNCREFQSGRPLEATSGARLFERTEISF